MSSRVVIDKKKVSILENAAIQALSKLGDFVLDDVVEKQVIPFDVGTLQNESTYVERKNLNDGCISIVSSTPYARRLYFNPDYNFNKANNPNAKGKWFEDWQNGGKHEKEVTRAYAFFIKKEGGL